jgi:hypothetical protein
VSDFNETLLFWTDFFKRGKAQNLIKIRSVAVELFHADGQTDRHEEANTRFSQFCGSA